MDIPALFPPTNQIHPGAVVEEVDGVQTVTIAWDRLGVIVPVDDERWTRRAIYRGRSEASEPDSVDVESRRDTEPEPEESKHDSSASTIEIISRGSES